MDPDEIPVLPTDTRDPSRRVYCDKCPHCTAYHCDGSTARHHFVHANTSAFVDESELGDWLQQHTGFPEYPERDSGL